MSGKGSEVVSPLGELLRFVLLLGHELDGVEGRRVRDDGLASLDDVSVLESYPNSASILDENLVDVGIQLELTIGFLEPALDSFTQLRSSTDGDRKGGVFLEESLQDVENVRRHGTLGGEPTENAHEIDKIADERNGYDLVDCLGQVVEGQGEIGKHVGVGGNEGKGTGRCGEETSILSKVEKGDSGGRSSEGLETVPEGVPFLFSTKYF